MGIAAPILLALYTANIIGAMLHPVKGKGGAFATPIIFADFHIRNALPISRVRIAALLVLAQHIGHKRIGVRRTPICHACCYRTHLFVAGNRSLFNTRRWRIKKIKLISSATVRGYYLTIGAILDSPKFFHWILPLNWETG
jgi:hypothetical protein